MRFPALTLRRMPTLPSDEYISTQPIYTFAYILIWEVRRRANLRGMTVETFRLQLLKIGVLVKETERKIKLNLASNFAWQEQFVAAWLRCCDTR